MKITAKSNTNNRNYKKLTAADINKQYIEIFVPDNIDSIIDKLNTVINNGVIERENNNTLLVELNRSGLGLSGKALTALLGDKGYYRHIVITEHNGRLIKVLERYSPSDYNLVIHQQIHHIIDDSSFKIPFIII